MRITLAQIEAFFWTARLGTVREAADKLCITQPSLSLRLRELEKTLGVGLFVRQGRNLRLSTHGRAILPKAEEMIGLGMDIEGQLSDLTDAAPQIIRLGVVDIFAMVSLSEFLDRMHLTHPNLSFELFVGFSQVLGHMLDEGRLDIVLLTNPQPDLRYQQRLLANVALCWMVSPDCDLPDGLLTPDVFQGLTIYTNPAPSLLHHSVHRWFQSAGLSPSRVYVCNTLAVISQLSTRRQGATLLPVAMHEIDEWARKLRRVKVLPEPEPHQLFAVWPKATGTAGLLAVVEMARNLVQTSDLYS